MRKILNIALEILLVSVFCTSSPNAKTIDKDIDLALIPYNKILG